MDLVRLDLRKGLEFGFGYDLWLLSCLVNYLLKSQVSPINYYKHNLI